MNDRAVGVLLTGGASRRLGRDKMTLVVGHETLAARAARVLTTVCDVAIEVGPGYTQLPSVEEEPIRSGPLRALVAAADTVPAPAYLLLAADMPGVDDAVLRLLVDHPATESVVPSVRGRLQLVCARWSATAVARARELVEGGARSLRALADAVPVTVLDESDWGQVATAETFADIDRPDDLARHPHVTGAE